MSKKAKYSWRGKNAEPRLVSGRGRMARGARVAGSVLVIVMVTLIFATAALVAFMDDDKRDPLLFSARYACPHCGHSVGELEPKLFSFNSPSGACPTCDGLGARQFFDPELVVADPELSLSEGAIRGWDRRNVYYFHMLQSLAKHYGFDIDKPFGKLPKKTRDIIFYGSGDEEIPIRKCRGRTRCREAIIASVDALRRRP